MELLLLPLVLIMKNIVPIFIVIAILIAVAKSGDSSVDKKRTAQTMWYSVGTAYFLNKMFNNKNKW